MFATIGEIVKLKSCYYVIVNKEGTMEKLRRLPWFWALWCEIRQGFGKYYTVEEVRKIANREIK